MAALKGIPRYATTWEKGQKDGWLGSVGDALWALIKDSCPEAQRHQLSVQTEWHPAQHLECVMVCVQTQFMREQLHKGMIRGDKSGQHKSLAVPQPGVWGGGCLPPEVLSA